MCRGLVIDDRGQEMINAVLFRELDATIEGYPGS